MMVRYAPMPQPPLHPTDIDHPPEPPKTTPTAGSGLNTHRPGALYETFEPAEAKALWDRFEFVHTPKHGSWLNVAKVELNVMIRQCLNRRIDSIDTLRTLYAGTDCVSRGGPTSSSHFPTRRGTGGTCTISRVLMGCDTQP